MARNRYTVKKGQSWFDIGKVTGNTEYELTNANPGVDNLIAGQVIDVNSTSVAGLTPGGRTPFPTAPNPITPAPPPDPGRPRSGGGSGDYGTGGPLEPPPYPGPRTMPYIGGQPEEDNRPWWEKLLGPPNEYWQGPPPPTPGAPPGYNINPPNYNDPTSPYSQPYGGGYLPAETPTGLLYPTGGGGKGAMVHTPYDESYWQDLGNGGWFYNDPSGYGYTSIIDQLFEKGIDPLVIPYPDMQRLGFTSEQMIEAGYEEDAWGNWVRKPLDEIPMPDRGGGGGGYGGGGAPPRGGGGGGGGEKEEYTPRSYTQPSSTYTGRMKYPERYGGNAYQDFVNMGLVNWRI